MQWIRLDSVEQLEAAEKESFKQPVLLYKHSYRCGISSAALGRLERGWPSANAPKAYFIDVLKNRDVSNSVATRFDVVHESPQILLLKDGRCELVRSHMDIDPAELR